MTNKEMAELTQQALEERFNLPDREQIKRLIECGTINERGEVIMGKEENHST